MASDSSVVKTMRFKDREITLICEKYQINHSQIGTLGKTLILDPKRVFNQEQIEDLTPKKKTIETKTLQEVDDEKGLISLSELKKELGITKRNQPNKIDSKGLWFRQNFEAYVQKFISNWDGDFGKMNEFMFRVSMMAKEEIYLQEYLRRVSVV